MLFKLDIWGGAVPTAKHTQEPSVETLVTSGEDLHGEHWNSHGTCHGTVLWHLSLSVCLSLST